jgi:ABC-type transport system involved in cytochrome c biogenesis permease subunit
MNVQSNVPPSGQSNQRNIIIGVVVAVLVLCCCCAGAAAVWYLWTYGDALLGVMQPVLSALPA